MAKSTGLIEDKGAKPQNRAIRGSPGDIAQVLEAASPVEQRQDEQREPAARVVLARRGTRRAPPTRQVVLPHVAPEQLEPAVRRQLLAGELDVQLPLDHPSQTADAP